MAVILFGFKRQASVKNEIFQFFRNNYPNISLKSSNSADTCLRMLDQVKVDLIIINQSVDESAIYTLLKKLDQNLRFANLTLMGIQDQANASHLSITDSFIANLLLPINFDEFKHILESNIPVFRGNKSNSQRAIREFKLKEKYDTRTSCFARCQAVIDQHNHTVDYKFIEINPEFAEFTNLMIEDIYNSTLKEMFPQFGQQFVQMFNSTPKNGKPLYFEGHSILKNKHFELISYRQSENIVNTIIIDSTSKYEEEQELIKQKGQFGERVKELRCIHNVTKILNEKHFSINEMLKKVVVLIPWAFKYPEIAKVKITVGEISEFSSDYKNTEWNIEENIIIDKKRIGKISVCYLKKKDKEYIGPFLRDEVNLLRSICELIAINLEKNNVQNDLDIVKQKTDLALLNGNLGVWDWNILNDQFLQSNKYSEIIGEKELNNELTINDWIQKIHPEDKAKIAGDIELNLNGKSDFYLNEYRIQTKPGNWKWVKDTGKVIQRDELGKPLKMMGIIRDIDREMRNKRELELRSDFDIILNKLFKKVISHKGDFTSKLLSMLRNDFEKIIGANKSLNILNNKILEEKGSKLTISNESINALFQSLGKKDFCSILSGSSENGMNDKLLDELKFSALLAIPIKFEKDLIGFSLFVFDHKNIDIVQYPSIIDSYSNTLVTILRNEVKIKNIDSNNGKY